MPKTFIPGARVSLAHSDDTAGSVAVAEDGSGDLWRRCERLFPGWGAPDGGLFPTYESEGTYGSAQQGEAPHSAVGVEGPG
jgi:hypothetical protein